MRINSVQGNPNEFAYTITEMAFSLVLTGLLVALLCGLRIYTWNDIASIDYGVYPYWCDLEKYKNCQSPRAYWATGEVLLLVTTNSSVSVANRAATRAKCGSAER